MLFLYENHNVGNRFCSCIRDKTRQVYKSIDATFSGMLCFKGSILMLAYWVICLFYFLYPTVLLQNNAVSHADI